MTRRGGTSRVNVDLRTDLLARADAEADRRVCSRALIVEGALAFYFDCVDAGETPTGFFPDLWAPATVGCPGCKQTVRAERTADGDTWYPRHPAAVVGDCVMSEQMVTPHKRGRR